jgi:predicted Abi (CAAX) family protease
MIASLIGERIVLSLTTIPTTAGWYKVVGITLATTACAGVGALATGFINLAQDWDPPTNNPLRSCSALIFPSLFEEVIWRGALIPSPALASSIPWPTAGLVLAVHVMFHPIAAATVWPRGKGIFADPRFLFLATIVLGGATTSYIISGGSVWAAALTHGLPVALWRDCFGGEKRLSKLVGNEK